MNKLFVLFVAAILLASCNSNKIINAPVTEIRDLDTLVVSAPKETPKEISLPKYNPSAKRDHDLLHTKLDLKFDWAKEQVIGVATLTLKPYFHESDKLTLDAKGFKFNKISMQGSFTPLKYEYDERQVTIQLDRSYTRDEKFTLVLDYVATPRGDGGSSAITSDKGLFFINPRNEEPDKPQQIWTQGETEHNSRWFPTIDKPNERTTQEIYVTVEDRFKTLSNGLKLSSKKNSDGTRTDYWKMDQPHAPYLFMLAIGEFAVVDDKWKNVPLEYYVEPEFEASAKQIFPHTPEMLTFFSDKLGVEYPWQKYSQVVVRDFVSGAMENTTGVIFGEFIQKHKEELEDNDDVNQMIVAHEMMHHWFGDYVTCESWSNLTLNEGFANYSEYLWAEHHEGRDKADHHRLNEMNSYLQSAQNGIHDLIHFGFNDKEDMFDAHSYNKGGLVLHMLRTYLGDDAFYASLKKYLNDNSFTAVEADELRMAFEDTTGEDLNWFFNQWFFDKGHPVMDIEYGYDASAKKATITVAQTQDPKEMPGIFQLPVNVDIYLSENDVRTEKIFVNQRKQTFEFDAPTEPKLISFDRDKVLLAEKAEIKTVDNYVFQFNNAKTFMDRYEAIQALQYESKPEVMAMFKKALDDPYHYIRAQAIDFLDLKDPESVKKLSQMISMDKSWRVRSKAMKSLAGTGNKEYTTLIRESLQKESKNAVKGEALRALQKLDNEAAIEYAKSIQNSENGALLLAVGDVYAAAGSVKNLSFFERNMDKMTGFDIISFLESYAATAAYGDWSIIEPITQTFNKIGSDMKASPWKRFGATKGINDLHIALATKALKSESETDAAAFAEKDKILIGLIEKIKGIETNDQLKMFYKNFPTRIEKRP